MMFPMFPRGLRPLLAVAVSGFVWLPSASVHAADGLVGIDGYNDGTDGKDHPAPALPKHDRADKSQYNLFNPTPDDLLRPFSSSRPDQTTGPHSVDAGHFYLETGVAYGLDLGATRTDTWTAFQSTHFRAGLIDNVELELIYDGLDQTRTQALKSSGNGRTDSAILGSAALTTRFRFVLYGNDNETFCFAADPEVILPTVSHHIASEYVQGDVIFTASVKLPAGFSVTINATPGILRNADDTRNDFGFTSGVTLYHNLGPKDLRIQAYLEYYDTLTSGSSDARQVDFGVRYRPLPNLQFDAGCNFGVSADATDYQPFAGVVVRF